MAEKSFSKEEVSELSKKLEKNFEDQDKQNQTQLCRRKKIQETKSLCQKGPVYVVEDRYGDIRYGKLIVKNENLLVTTFQLEKPEDATLLNFSELLSRLYNGLTGVPTMGFLVDTSDVEYHFVAESMFSFNFILLCSGLKGSTYKGRTMRKFIYDGSSYYQMPRGNVYGSGPKWDWNSWFEIVGDGPSLKYGVSVDGVQKPTGRDLVRREYYSIKDCGLVVVPI